MKKLLATSLILVSMASSAVTIDNQHKIVGIDSTKTTWAYNPSSVKNLVIQRGNEKLPVTVFYLFADQGSNHSEGYGAAICQRPGMALFTSEPQYDYSDLHPEDTRTQQWVPGEVQFQMLHEVCKK